MVAIAIPIDDWAPLWTSLTTALTATLLDAWLGIITARWMMRYRGRWRGLLDGVCTLPLVLPPTVVGFLLLMVLGANGLVGQLLNRLGVSIIFSWSAIAIAATVVAFPLMYRSALAAFEQVDATLISAARTLGASEWRLFWQVILPLSWPGLLSGVVLTFARAFGEFGATLMVGGSIPGLTQTMPIAIFFAAEAGQMALALAWVMLMVAVSLGAIAVITASQDNGKMDHPRWMRPWFNGIYFGQFGGLAMSALCARDRHDKEPPTHDIAAPSVGWSQPPDLQVAIANHVPGFQLQVTFSAGPEPLGLLGASGSGKSMTLRCIAGLDKPSEGKIVLNGRVLFDSKAGVDVPSCDRQVGMMFQNYALFPHLTVAQNIAFGMPGPRQERLSQIKGALTQFDLQHLGDRYPAQLSGGQQQRVALSRALASQPQVLLLDEPLSALDTYLRSRTEQTLKAVLSQYRGVTLFVTHKLEEVYRVCPHLLVISQGCILAADSREAVFTAPSSRAVAQVTECKNFSRAGRISDRRLWAYDWGCELQVKAAVPVDLVYVGIRAHHLQFSGPADSQNSALVWLSAVSETQHWVTLYITLHQPPNSEQDYHLQADIYREVWYEIQQQPLPWRVYLDPDHIIMMCG